MLPKKFRLTQKVDFQKVLREGKAIHGKYFIFLVLKSSGQEKKLGFIVSNKVSKSAVERNKIRRAGRKAAYTLLSSLPDGILGVFLAKAQAAGRLFVELEKDAESVLDKVK